jgi:SAM-dependent methyltransferase
MYDSDAIIRDLEIMSGARNYAEWIFSKFKNFLGKRVVEIGAGIGNFTDKFLDKELVVAVDNYKPCIEHIKNRFADNNNIIPLEASIDSASILSLSLYSPDTIVCINVLEHVENDIAALENMFSILTEGGKLILIVPAFQFMYGTIDRLVGHYRRYSKRDIETKLVTAGFYVKSISYMNCMGPFGWFLNNRILKKREESLSQVIFYDRFVVPWLRKIEQIFTPPFGLSLIVVGEKSFAANYFKHKLSVFR